MTKQRKPLAFLTVCLLLAICIAFAAQAGASEPTRPAAAGERWDPSLTPLVARYGKTNVTDVIAYDRADAGADTVVQIVYIGTPVVSVGFWDRDGGEWYYILCGEYDGYVPGGQIDWVEPAEYDALIAQMPWAFPPGFSREAPVPEQGTRYGKTNAAGVNIREGTSTGDRIVVQIPNTGSAFVVTGEAVDASNVRWYQVEYEGKRGYVRGDFVDEATADEARGVAIAVAGAEDTQEAPASVTPVSVASVSGQSGSGGTEEDAPTSPTSAPQQQSASPTEAPKTSGSGNVWIPTNGGKKYHTHSGCSRMIDPALVTVDEAIYLGFDPCKKCY